MNDFLCWTWVLIALAPVRAQEQSALAPVVESSKSEPSSKEESSAEKSSDDKPEVVTPRPTDLSEAELPANARVADARDKFALLRIDESSYRRLLQGKPLSGADFEVLTDLLYRLPLFDVDMIEALVQEPPAWKELAEHTTNYVGGVYEVAGTLRSYQDLSPPPFDRPVTPRPPATTPDEILVGMAERKTVQSMYRCLVDVVGLENPVEVYALDVPNAWRKEPAVGDRVAFRGVLLKSGGEHSPAFYFAAPRVMWYPESLLGRLGLDHGLLDALAQKATILRREQEVFYRFMAAAFRYPAADFARVPTSNDRILELWEHPEQHVGELESFRGLSYHVDKIMIEDPERVKRLGFDHFYYMELFAPPMKNGREASLKLNIKLPVLDPAGEPTGAETVEAVHFDRLPVVYYFRELPPGETPESLRNRSVRVAGFFFKAWRYQSNYELKNKEHAMLIGPLIMGVSPLPEALATSSATASWPAMIVLAVMAGALLLGMFYLVVQKREADKRHAALPDKISIEM